MFVNINSIVQIVIDKFIKTMFQRFKNLINKQHSLSIIEFVFTTNVRYTQRPYITINQLINMIHSDRLVN